MPYVIRDSDGRITSVHIERSSIATEELDIAAPELQAFLGRSSKVPHGVVKDDLAASDIDMIRVLEDLIAVLIDKRVIVMTDLPSAAQKKLSRRYGLRSKLTDLGSIVGDSEELMLP
ncbi:hypothetical protein [Pelagibius sp. Alg239-R121]|uniref:hypothetical protein n=1 Tax=Pelagibius sp. Alg239-R121 TaxID=2993448 RepID=UPI0024A63BDE|nr:hypothetical protein [Pelagibius sp. Alg239-R121]